MEYLVILAVLAPLSCASLFSVTTYQFRRLYLKPTFETWRLKYNKKYPTVPDVTNEIIALTKCILATALLLALSVQLGVHGYSSRLGHSSRTTACTALLLFVWGPQGHLCALGPTVAQRPSKTVAGCIPDPHLCARF